MRTVALLGGSRFVGAAIARRFVDAGDAVTLFHRGVTGDALGDRVSRRTFDRGVPGSLAAAVGASCFDVVVDVSAYRPADSGEAVAAFVGRCGRFLHVSTGQIYLVRRDGAPPSTEDQVGPPFHPEPDDPDEHREWLYGIEKWGCEERLRAAFETQALPVVRVRLPVVLGPGDPTLRLQRVVEAVRAGHPIATTDGGRNVLRHVHVRDVGEGFFRLAGAAGEALIGEAINLAQRETPTFADLVTEVASLLGRAPPPLLALGESSWSARRRAGGILPFTSRWSSFLDIARAERALAWDPTPWRSTIAEAVAAGAGRPHRAP